MYQDASAADFGRLKADLDAIRRVIAVNCVDGNSYRIEGDGAIFLTLRGSEEERAVGRIFVYGGFREIIYEKHLARAKHFFQEAKGWGLCAHVVRSIQSIVGDRFLVHIIADGQSLWAEGRDVLRADWTWFKRKGYEQQVVVLEEAFKEQAAFLAARRGQG